MVRVVGARVRYVVKNLFTVETEALCDSQQPNGAERALRVDVEALALATTHAHGQLASDGECVAELRLARAELAKHLGDCARLDSTWRRNESAPPNKKKAHENHTSQKRVELFGAGGDVDEL